MIPEDFRKLTLLDWLENDLLLPVERLEPASSDASFRRYFRITLPDRHLIVMDAPPDKENVAAFIKTRDILAQAKVSVPAIYQQNLDYGFLVLEDFGSTSYLDQLKPNNVNELYDAAITALLALQSNTPINNTDLPHYDEALLMRELAIFEEWFIEKRLGLALPEALWANVCSVLVNSALQQPKTCVHRDYHSRNLMYRPNNPPGVIDFQDAVIGPVTYDAVSLLRDCYIDWPQAQINQWLTCYYDALRHVGIVQVDLATFTRWFDLMGLQRHLKAIGIFSRLDIRDNKPSYLQDIPRTLGYVIAQTGKYPELADFGCYIQDNIDVHNPIN
jgi:N-acetylmuramate 1-kinase